MRVFKSKRFARLAIKEGISDQHLCRVLDDIGKGLSDADLGSGVIKQRIARENEGDSGGYRTIIFFRKAEKAFFVHLFAKNDLSNIDRKELKAFRQAARVTLALTDDELKRLIKSKALIEVNCRGK